MPKYSFFALLTLLCFGLAFVVACGGGKGSTTNIYVADDDSHADDDQSPG